MSPLHNEYKTQLIGKYVYLGRGPCKNQPKHDRTTKYWAHGKDEKQLQAQTLRNCESLLDAVININVFRLSRLPAAMTLKDSVINAIISGRSGRTRTQGMKTELRWVNPNVFQVPSKSIPITIVADRFVWGY